MDIPRYPVSLKKGFEDTNATYGFKIIDECKNTLFDLTDGLNKNRMVVAKLHNSKRHCSDKLRKRLPNGAMTTQNGEGSGYAGLSK
ncbi:unnamed protein product [Rhizophagus irregularis]|nr:unnamed protein product [Rhizophagus irregularis]